VTAAHLLVRLLVVLGAFRLLGLPIARWALPGLPATSYALATGVALVLATHATWLIAHLGLRLAAPSLAIGIAAVAALSLFATRALARSAQTWKPRWLDVATHHVAFLGAFAFALLVTARNPGVDPDSERFMDFAMVQAALASRELPLEDPWLAGERVAYYDYGYYATAYLSLLAGPPETLFPVAVALLYAALFAGVLALGRDLSGEIGGLIAAYLVAFAGNLDGLLQTIRHGLWTSFDWFHGARVLEGEITEFPLFTLLWGDLHPYALALPLWPPLLAVAALVWRGHARAPTLAVAAVFYAALAATHTWDSVAIAALLVLAALFGQRRLRAALAPLAVVGGGLLLALPYLSHMPTGGRGLGWVSEPSTLAELFNAWGAPALILAAAALTEVFVDHGLREKGFAAFSLLAALLVVSFRLPGVGIALAALSLALVLAWRRPGPQAFAWGLGAVGAGLVFGVELVYVDDFYSGDLERMNTVFKAYVQAWVLLQMAAALLLAGLVERARAAGPVRRSLVLALLATSVLATVVYPLRAIPERAGDLLAPRRLDATLDLSLRYPDDARAIRSLGALPRGVVLETTGDPYTWNSRFATFTGFPTVVGWGHHEAGWRNTWEPMQERAKRVKEAYSASTLEAFDRLARDFAIRYVVVGELEREQYGEQPLQKFSVLKPVVSEGRTVVYEVARR